MKLPKKADAMVGHDKELNDSEEGFLNPEDLSIIDEKTWEPSDEEILSYALKLGYDIEKDPDELFEVAYYYMKYPLPDGWRRAIYKKTKELMYINMEDGEIEVVTEIEEMAHQMYLEKKEEMIGKQLGLLDKEDKKEVKNEEKNKIPPLNPIKKSTSPPKSPTLLPSLKDKTNSKNNLLNELENELLEKKVKNDMGIDTDLDFDKNKDLKKKNNEDIFDIIDKDTKMKEKEEEKKDEDKKEKNEKKDDIYGMHVKESEEEEENEYGDEFDYDGIDDDSDLNKGEPLIKSMINKEKEKEEKEKIEKEKLEKELMELKEKELKELLEKEEKEKEKKEREDREEKERKEKELKELKEKEEREKEEREKEERERKEKEEKEKREKELREQKLKEEKEREKLEKEKKEKEEKERKLRKELEREKELNDKLIKEKKNYLNKKLKELQEYKEEKKRNYEKVKKEKEEKNKKLKEEYNSKLEKNLNKNKTKLQSQYKEKIELYESQLINKKSKEEKSFTNDQKYKFEEKQKDSKKKKEKEYEEKKNELKEKKNKLMKEIKEEKSEKEKNESSMKDKKLNLQKNIKLLEEKKKIDINNKNKKHDLLIKDYEIELENKLLKEKEQIKEYITNNNILTYNTSTSSLNFSMSGINKEDENNEFIKSKLMENIQKSLEEEYEINCKEIEQQLNNNKIKEIEKYKISMEQEIKDKIQFYKNENISNEKEYYKMLSNIRQNSQRKKLDGDKYLNEGFEQTMKQHEETKNKISIDNKKLMTLVIEGIQKLILQNNSIEQTEIYIEEYLIELKDTYFIMFQKNKNVYEMEEYEFRHKKLFIKYLLDVINYLSKMFCSANNIYDIDKKYISENLLQFCKNKINDYKNKYQNKKKKRLYKFLNDNLLSKTQPYSILTEFDKIKETNNIFVNSFKRKYDNEKININLNTNIDNNKNENILNKINVDESINNITRNSFTFKKINNLLENQNNNLANTMNNFNKYNNNYNFNSSNGFNNMNFYSTFNRTKSTNDYNINDKFFKLLNKKQDNINKIEYYTFEENINYKIPLIPEIILQNIDEEVLIAYSDIIIFLKNEYMKLIEINKGKKIKKNVNLNKLILDKIEIYAEETFNFIINNYGDKDQYKNIQRKIKTVQNNVEDFKKNFNVDKYLENPNLYKTISLADYIINNKMISNGQNSKTTINGINKLILNGNLNEFEEK